MGPKVKECESREVMLGNSGSQSKQKKGKLASAMIFNPFMYHYRSFLTFLNFILSPSQIYYCQVPDAWEEQ